MSGEQGASAKFQMQPMSAGARAARAQHCSVTSTCKSHLNQAAAPPVGQDAIVHTRAKVFFIVKSKNKSNSFQKQTLRETKTTLKQKQRLKIDFAAACV